MTDLGADAGKAAVGGVAGAVTFLVATGLLVRTNILGCGDGLDSLGCAIATVLMAQLGSLLVSAAVGAVVLRALHARSPIAVGISGALSAGALWPVTSALSTSRPLAFIVVGVAYVVMYVLHSQLPVRHGALRVAVTLVVAVFAFVQLRPVGARVEHEQFERKQRARVVNRVTFTVYEPSVLPSGFTYDSTRLQDGILGGDLVSYEFRYRGIAAPSSSVEILTITSFVVRPTYQPPRDCGWPRPAPDPPARPISCEKVGTLPSGEPVYWEEDETCANCWWYYVRKGNTLVTVETHFDLKKAQALPMLASLRPVSMARLQDLVA